MVPGGRLNMLIAGVGGQGIITLARLIAETAVAKGVDALVAETHGLSQRGGSVEVHVRLGRVLAPLTPRGGVDVLLGLELLEAARRTETLSPTGVVLTADVIMKPALPGVKLPPKEEVVRAINEAVDGRLVVVPASKLAREAGGLLYTNTVMLGALAASGLLGDYLTPEDLEGAVSKMKRAEANLKAYKLGFDYCVSACRDLRLKVEA